MRYERQNICDRNKKKDSQFVFFSFAGFFVQLVVLEHVIYCKQASQQNSHSSNATKTDGNQAKRKVMLKTMHIHQVVSYNRTVFSVWIVWLQMILFLFPLICVFFFAFFSVSHTYSCSSIFFLSTMYSKTAKKACVKSFIRYQIVELPVYTHEYEYEYLYYC